MTFRKRKYTKRRHHRGGNFGGHCPDPFNYSIYNSNMLKLFPYRAWKRKICFILQNSFGKYYLGQRVFLYLTTATTFSILDRYIPIMDVTARSGSCFGIGANLVKLYGGF